jgi:hypothetical protein
MLTKMRNNLRKIIKEEISDFDWVGDVPEYFSSEIYKFLEENTDIETKTINNDFLTDTPTEFKVLVYKYQDDDYKESVNITFNNKKRVLRMLVDFVEYHFEDTDERTIKKTVRTFLNDKVYI